MEPTSKLKDFVSKIDTLIEASDLNGICYFTEEPNEKNETNGVLFFMLQEEHKERIIWSFIKTLLKEKLFTAELKKMIEKMEGKND